MPTAAIILAAGASTRLGEPKQLLHIGSETMLARTIRIVREAGCTPIIVVMGAHAETIREHLGFETERETEIVLNPDWQQGMATSIRTGIATVPPGHDAVIVTCDMPAVTPEHLRELMHSGNGQISVASDYEGRHGVPAYFPASSFSALTQLTGDQGARDLLLDSSAIPLPGGELDIDTPADLERLRATLG
jgi:CTP:molybdopterin cytidylyltransferase MocA